MAGTPSYLFDQAFARILSPADDLDDPPPPDSAYNFKAYISEPSYLESEPWGDLSAQVQYKDETADRLAALKSVVPLEVPKTAAKAVMGGGGGRGVDRTEAVPTTKLMQKLFKTGGDGARSKAVEPSISIEEKLTKLTTEKLDELEQEISKQKLYQDKLSLLKRLIPEKNKAIEKERTEIEEAEKEAREEIRLFREIEIQKAEKDLRIRERNQKALFSLPSRKDREEKESLLSTLQKLQEDSKARKARHQLAKERLNKQLEDVKSHREELMREKGRMELIMPVEGELNAGGTGGAVQGRRLAGVVQREVSPETRKPIDQTFEEQPSQCVYPSSEASFPSFQEVYQEGKAVRVHSDGHEETLMQSGTRREVYSNGYTVVKFANGDEKRDFPDGKSVYFYSAPGTTQVVHPSGLQVYYFSDGQKETHFPDGSKKIRFPNGTKKTIKSTGEESSTFLDGLVVEVDGAGGKTTLHPGGHKDVVYPDGRRLRYLFNGTVQRLS